MTAPPPEDLPAGDRKTADGQGDAWERYMASCTDYIKRQLIIYQNWPQRTWGPGGYREGKVFRDLNN